MFEQVQAEKYSMQIVGQIRQSILDGKLKAGDRLPAERELAKEFGTSRACMREALSALEAMGLVECKIGHGNFIKVDASEASIDGELLKELLRSHSPYEIYESRLEIEPSLAHLAAARASAEEKRRLKAQLGRLRELGRRVAQTAGTGDEYASSVEEYMEEDRKYHLLIGRCAHNGVLFMIFSAVNLMMKEASWKVLKRKSIAKEGSLERFEREHDAIFRSIENGTAGAARATMRKHIRDIEKDLFRE
jgi:GntR family transcriptional regulator, transcriptional repressor for pyruvate dehydrogenase complex